MPDREMLTGDVVRFLIAGGINTGLTSAIYLIASLFMAPGVAYTLCWIVGLVFVALIYPERVFVGGHKDLRSRLAFVGSAMLVFVIGLGLLQLLTGVIGIHQIAFFITLAMTTILNFALGRLISRRT